MAAGGEPHPKMRVLTDAQEHAYGGTTVAEQRAAWSAYTASLAPPRPPSLLVRDAIVPAAGNGVPGRGVPVARAEPDAICGFLRAHLFRAHPLPPR